MPDFSCTICPFNCKCDREKTFGVCGLPNKFLVSHVQPHFYEEPMISGCGEDQTKGGSGGIFFTGCNGRCVFCQNYLISQREFWEKKTQKESSEKELFEICLDLIENKKCHNINFVTPTPYSHLLREFLIKYKDKIKVPIIWNSNGYERVETIKSLKGLVDVYLPDIKYFSNDLAIKFSKIPDYFNFASEAIKEMHSQVGFPRSGSGGMIEKGLIIRHLVLPENIEDSKKVLNWIKNTFNKKAHVSLMAQYYPVYKSKDFPEINRPLTKKEYANISDYFISLGFEDGLIQDLESSDQKYTPGFK
ncbi:radical SAM protein [Candidatus Peregrinibacteria bacterium]|nr:radical SAM protein [Candidatus Peregrinibacteria bacterium]